MLTIFFGQNSTVETFLGNKAARLKGAWFREDPHSEGGIKLEAHEEDGASPYFKVEARIFSPPKEIKFSELDLTVEFEPEWAEKAIHIFEEFRTFGGAVWRRVKFVDEGREAIVYTGKRAACGAHTLGWAVPLLDQSWYFEEEDFESPFSERTPKEVHTFTSEPESLAQTYDPSRKEVRYAALPWIGQTIHRVNRRR